MTAIVLTRTTIDKSSLPLHTHQSERKRANHANHRDLGLSKQAARPSLTRSRAKDFIYTKETDLHEKDTELRIEKDGIYGSEIAASALPPLEVGISQIANQDLTSHHFLTVRECAAVGDPTELSSPLNPSTSRQVG